MKNIECLKRIIEVLIEENNNSEEWEVGFVSALNRVLLEIEKLYKLDKKK